VAKIKHAAIKITPITLKIEDCTVKAGAAPAEDMTDCAKAVGYCIKAWKYPPVPIPSPEKFEFYWKVRDACLQIRGTYPQVREACP
jgi:hypothetical protein